MRSPRVLVLEPKLVKEILISNFKNFRDNEFSQMFNSKNDPLFARNPFLSASDVWKERRTEISPAFSSNRTKSLYPAVEIVCERLTSFINENLSQIFEVKELAGKFTTEAVSKCVFGIDANALTKSDNELRTMSQRLFKPSAMTIVKIMLQTAFPSLKLLLNIQFIPDDVNAFFMNLLNQAMAHRTKSNIAQDDYLDYLVTLQKKKGLSNMDLAGHSITFFSDGLETSSLLIAYALYEVRF